MDLQENEQKNKVVFVGVKNAKEYVLGISFVTPDELNKLRNQIATVYNNDSYGCFILGDLFLAIHKWDAISIL